MNCGDCILLRAALRNRRSRLLFANYIRAFRAFSRSKNLTAVYAYSKAQETKFYGKLSPKPQIIFRLMFFSLRQGKISADIQAYFKRNLTPYCGKQPEKSDFHNVGFLFLCHIVNFFNVFVGYLLNFVLTVVELVFGYGFIFVELF